MNKFPWYNSTDDKSFLTYDPVKEKRKEWYSFCMLAAVLVPFVWYLTECTK